MGPAKGREREARQRKRRGTSVFVLFDRDLSSDDVMDGCPPASSARTLPNIKRPRSTIFAPLVAPPAGKTVHYTGGEQKVGGGY